MPNRRQFAAMKAKIQREREQLEKEKERLAQNRLRMERQKNTPSVTMNTRQSTEPLKTMSGLKVTLHNEQQPKKEEYKPFENDGGQVSSYPERGEAIMIISDEEDEELSPQEKAKQKAADLSKRLEAKRLQKDQEEADRKENSRKSIASKLDERQQKAFKFAEESHEKAQNEKGTLFYEKKQELQTRIDAGLVNVGITTQKERDEILRKAKAAKEIESYQQAKTNQKTAAQQR